MTREHTMNHGRVENALRTLLMATVAVAMSPDDARAASFELLVDSPSQRVTQRTATGQPTEILTISIVSTSQSSKTVSVVFNVGGADRVTALVEAHELSPTSARISTTGVVESTPFSSLNEQVSLETHRLTMTFGTLAVGPIEFAPGGELSPTNEQALEAYRGEAAVLSGVQYLFKLQRFLSETPYPADIEIFGHLAAYAGTLSAPTRESGIQGSSIFREFDECASDSCDTCGGCYYRLVWPPDGGTQCGDCPQFLHRTYNPWCYRLKISACGIKFLVGLLP